MPNSRIVLLLNCCTLIVDVALFRPEAILLNNIPPPHCLESSLEFLKKRKMQVSRSSAILKNADQALRLISSKGNLLSKS